MSIQEDAALVGNSRRDLGAHQGVATDTGPDGDYWIFHTGWIRRYDSDWVFQTGTDRPFLNDDGTVLDGFEASESESDSRTISAQAHLGSGTYYRSTEETHGHLYVPAEKWPSVLSQHVLKFNAETLEREASVATSQTHEVAAATVAPDETGVDRLYVASFKDSSRLFRYNLQTLEYIDSVALSPAPAVGIQGLTYREDKDLFILAVGRNATSDASTRPSARGQPPAWSTPARFPVGTRASHGATTCCCGWWTTGRATAACDTSASRGSSCGTLYSRACTLAEGWQSG